MTPELIIYIGREAVFTILMIAGPLLVGSILIGLTISIFQATTQIQEQTLTFVPKIVAIFIMIVILGPWMLNILLAFTNNLFIIMTKMGS